ncbi:hypothetical protein B0H14DRAFT_2630327 [Mycena olivaceomarginata]|nr:hypothetical protein B0H14DRAFT_2630327 [Mycena olivaceomarginata]
MRLRLASGAALARGGECDSVFRAIEERETLNSRTIRLRLASGAALARDGYCDSVFRAIEEREALNSRTIWRRNTSRAAIARLGNWDVIINTINKVSVSTYTPPEQAKTNQAINGQLTLPQGTQVGQQVPGLICAVWPRGLSGKEDKLIRTLIAHTLDLPFHCSTADQRAIDLGDGAHYLRDEERSEDDGKGGEFRLHVQVVESVKGRAAFESLTPHNLYL